MLLLGISPLCHTLYSVFIDMRRVADIAFHFRLRRCCCHGAATPLLSLTLHAATLRCRHMDFSPPLLLIYNNTHVAHATLQRYAADFAAFRRAFAFHRRRRLLLVSI